MLDKKNLNTSIKSESRNIVRSVFGVVSTVFVVIIFNIPMPQVAALFTIMLLTKDSKPLGVKNAIAAIIVVVILGFLGLVIGGFIQDYPLESILLISLLVFWSFKLVIIPEPLRMMFLTFTLMFPFLSLTSETVALFVFGDLLVNLIISLVITQLAFTFFPDTEIPIEKPQEKSIEKKALKIEYNINKIALNGLFMLLPIILYFFYFRLNTLLVTLIYIVILGLDPLIYKSKHSYHVILANLIGGSLAIIAYNLLTITPSFFFYIIIITAAGIFFTYNIFSTKKLATLVYPMAYRAFYLVLSIIFSSSSSTAEDSLTTRLFGILIAIVYVVVMYQFLNFINNPIIEKESIKMTETNLKSISE